MRILVLSFYYPPDLSAGSPRIAALVDELRDQMPAGSHIDVVTTLPNRYSSFAADAPSHEERPGVSIHRIALRRHNSGMLDQSLAFWRFARVALVTIKNRKYDLVFATSSRLMTAALAGWVARREKARLYLDIRDIFVDTIKDVLPRAVARPLKHMSSALERLVMRRADKVNLVSPAFLDYFAARYPGQRFSCFTNGVDDAFARAAPAASCPSPRHAGADTITVLYAGNIGEGQGLHLIVPALARQLGGRAQFRIFGDGGRRGELIMALQAGRITNVEVLPPVDRGRLLEAYRTSDVLFVHLNDYPAFERVLPSKLFEYAAMGKPVLAGVSGFAAGFVQSEIENAAVFRPCDVAGAIRALNALRLEDAPRAGFVAKYTRTAISRRMAQDVLSVAAG